MSANPSDVVIKTSSTFQPKDLTQDEASSSTTTTTKESTRRMSKLSQTLSKNTILTSEFPPPVIINTKKNLISIPENSEKNRKFNLSHHFLGFILINLLLAAVILPFVIIQITTYNLPNYDLLNQNLIPGYHLTKLQVFGIFLFVCIDICIYLITYFTAFYSPAFVGCSTKLNLKIFNGSQFIPTILIVKLLQPLAIVGSEDDPYDIIIWSIRLLTCLLLFITFFPLLISEIRLIRSIKHVTSMNSKDMIDESDPIQQYSLYLKQFFTFNQQQQIERKKLTHDRRFPAVVFFCLKISTIFWFLFEVVITNMGSFSPLFLDYPLIISIANVIFIFYSHQPILIKYNLIDNKRTVFTHEYACLDGRHCCNKFRSSELLKYEKMSYSFIQPSTLEYTVYSLTELPNWLKRAIRRKIAVFH